MARRTRVSLADLSAGIDDEPAAGPAAASPTSVRLAELQPNPRNPRDDVGTLEDLASIADMQLQPAVVVTAAAYTKLYPDDTIEGSWVVINGCRRLAAAHKYGRDTLEIVVKDELAADRSTLLTAAIRENVDRTDFDVLEEAKAVEALVTETGSAAKAAAALHRSTGWVSQRRALLDLAPELQQSLRQGELAVREARSLARVPLHRQVEQWQKKTAAQPGDKPAKPDKPEQADTASQERAQRRAITVGLAQFGTQPHELAAALHDVLGDSGTATLITHLKKIRKPAVT